MNELYLCFIKYIGKDIEEYNNYEFLFTDNIDTFWGENFEYMPCCLCDELIPNDEDFNTKKFLRTKLNLTLIQDSCCHSFQDCADGIIALAYENISDYEEYPEDGRLVLHYGISIEETEDLLSNKGLVFE